MEFLITDYGTLVEAWRAAVRYSNEQGAGTLYIIGTWEAPRGIEVRINKEG